MGFHIDVPPPHIDVPPPHIDVPPPHIDVPPPHVDVPPLHVDVPPPHVDVPPLHVDVPPPHVDLPPPHVDVPPFHVDVPPPHVDVPPLHVDLPPPHIDIPPFHIDVPPPHIDVPPLHVDVPSPHVDIPRLHIDVPPPHIDIPPIKLPRLRRLTPDEETVLVGVYGSSIDFSTVFLSDVNGAQGRAFVVGIPTLPSIQIMNIGPGKISSKTLIHEAAHVWQSQHHPDPTAFMVNSLASQALEEAANKAAGVTSFSSYAYVPGKRFIEYASEQIAQQVGNGEPSICAHVRSIPARVIDPANVVSLTIPRIEDTNAPGVKR